MPEVVTHFWRYRSHTTQNTDDDVMAILRRFGVEGFEAWHMQVWDDGTCTIFFKKQEPADGKEGQKETKPKTKAPSWRG